MVMLGQRFLTTGAAIACLLLAGCGGGGASAGSPSTETVAQSSGGSTNIQFAIKVRTTDAGGRRVEYISAATKSAQIIVTPKGASAMAPITVNCATTCSANVNAPLGEDAFKVTLFDADDARGNVLSQGSTTATIVAGTTNNVTVVFGGNVARVALNPSSFNFTTGVPAQTPLTITAYDASGQIIIGSQPFATPVTFSVADAGGALSISDATFENPSSTAVLKYSGQPLSGAKITANVAGAPLQTADISVQSSAAPSDANVRSHMMIYAQLPGNFHNRQWVDSPAQVAENYRTVAKYVDYMETDNRASNYAHAAGIKVGFYTDPIQAHGHAYDWPDAAFAHDCSGRVIVPNYPPAPQKLGDVNSPVLRQYWNAEIQSHLKDQWGTYAQDFVRSDDSSIPSRWWPGYFAGVLNGPKMPKAAPYCGYTDAKFLSGVLALYNQAALPVLFNGATDPSYQSYVAGQPNVLGGQCETCFGGWTGQTWREHVDTEITFVRLGKHFNSFSHGNATHDQMLYLYASMLLGYDPRYVSLFMDIPTPSGISTTPLVNVVPMQPVLTAQSVDGYRDPGGVYVRKFGACYIAKKPVGACAVVVNSDTTAHPYPATLANFGHTVNFSGSGIATEYGDTGKVSADGPAYGGNLNSGAANILFQ